jgi:hypothetical protein
MIPPSKPSMSLLFQTSTFTFLALLLAFFNSVSKAQDPLKSTKKLEDLFGKGRNFYSLGSLGAQGLPHPKGFEIQALLPQGSAFKAGLAHGDICLGIAGKKWESLSFPQIWWAFGEAIESAEIAEKPLLELLILRPPQTLPQRLSIPLAPLPPHSPSCPSTCAKCLFFKQQALKTLNEEQFRAYPQKKDPEYGALPTELGATNGLCVVTCLGLLAHLDDPPLTHELQKTLFLQFLKKNAGKDPIARLTQKQGVTTNWNQTNWAWAFCGIATGLWLKTQGVPKKQSSEIKRLQKKAITHLLENQLSSGGWGHGPGGLNALGYNEFSFITALALIALGLAQQQEHPIPSKSVHNAFSYLSQAQSPSGGVGYSALKPFPGDVGRTSLFLLALAAFDRKNDPLFIQNSQWVLKHFKTLESSHQGYLLHFLFTAMALRETSPEAFLRFWKYYRTEIFLSRKGDLRFFFTSRPSKESLVTNKNTDTALGDLYCTTVYALLFQLSSDSFPFYSPSLTGKK